MKNNISRIFSNNKFVMLFSLIASFVLWFALSSQNIQQVSITKNIAISWDASIDSMQQNYENFDVITVDGKLPSEYKKISVTVIGAASSVSSISDSDISISPDLTGFTEPQTKTINLNAQIINNSFSSCTISKIEPETVEVRVDKYVEKEEFTVQAQYKNLILKPGMENTFVLGTASFKNSNNKILISGPKTEVDSIASVVCLADFENQETDVAVEKTGKIVLYDKNGKEISQRLLTLSYKESEISVPILSKKTVKIKPNFVNGPNTFMGKYELSVDTITIRGTADIIENINEIYTKDIDLSVLSLTEVENLKVELNIPSGVSVMDDNFADSVYTVYAKIDLTELSSTVVSVTKINFKNLQNDSSAEMIQSSINIKVAGTESEINAITQNNITATVDMKGLSSATTIELPITVKIKDLRSVYVVYENGKPYTAEIEIS